MKREEPSSLRHVASFTAPPASPSMASSAGSPALGAMLDDAPQPPPQTQTQFLGSWLESTSHADASDTNPNAASPVVSPVRSRFASGPNSPAHPSDSAENKQEPLVSSSRSRRSSCSSDVISFLDSPDLTLAFEQPKHPKAGLSRAALNRLGISSELELSGVPPPVPNKGVTDSIAWRRVAGRGGISVRTGGLSHSTLDLSSPLNSPASTSGSSSTVSATAETSPLHNKTSFWRKISSAQRKDLPAQPEEQEIGSTASTESRPNGSWSFRVGRKHTQLNHLFSQ